MQGHTDNTHYCVRRARDDKVIVEGFPSEEVAEAKADDMAGEGEGYYVDPYEPDDDSPLGDYDLVL